MEHLAILTFDLNAPNNEKNDYEKLYAKLFQMGFDNHLKDKDNSSKKKELPTTTVVGFFDGANAAQISTDIYNEVLSFFNSNSLHGKILSVVSKFCAWTINEV